MGKTVEGYVLDITTAAGIASVPVTIYDANTNSALAGVVGLSTNPVNTDANGHFKFTMDLSPGPVYVDAANGGKHDRRMGLEQMQIGDHWMSDIPTLLHLFTDGVIRTVLNEFAVSVSGGSNQFTVATGEAIVQGYAWSLSSGSYTQTIPPNTTLANRKSIVVLRQYLDASYQGKQVIDLLLGTSNGVKPTLRQGVGDGSGNTIWEFPLATLNTAQNAGVSTIDSDDRVFSAPVGTVSPRLGAELVDDFRGAGPNLAWSTFTSVSNPGAVSSVVNPGVNHPGIATLTTSGANNSMVGIAQRDLYETTTQSAEWIFRLLQSVTQTFTIGLFALSGSKDGVGVEFDTSQGDSALSLVKYVAGTRTVIDTVPLNTAHWYRLNWSRGTSGGGTLILVDIDAPSTKTVTVSGLTAGACWSGYASLTALAAAVKNAYLDWFRVVTSGISR